MAIVAVLPTLAWAETKQDIGDVPDVSTKPDIQIAEVVDWSDVLSAELPAPKDVPKADAPQSDTAVLDAWEPSEVGGSDATGLDAWETTKVDVGEPAKPDVPPDGSGADQPRSDAPDAPPGLQQDVGEGDTQTVREAVDSACTAARTGASTSLPPVAMAFVVVAVRRKTVHLSGNPIKGSR